MLQGGDRHRHLLTVYNVKNERNTLKSKTLHRNRLLLIGYVDLQEEKLKPAPRKSIKETRGTLMNASKHEDSDSDTNTDEILVHEAASVAQSKKFKMQKHLAYSTGNFLMSKNRLRPHAQRSEVSHQSSASRMYYMRNA